MQKTSPSIITGAELPRQGWSSRSGARLYRDMFLAPSLADMMPARSQPTHGGLYTSTLIYHRSELLGTHWTEFNTVRDKGRLLYQVTAKPKARIVVIDSQDDLRAAVVRWPYVNESHSPFRGIFDRDSERNTTVHWPAAAREIDAVWLTVDGNSEVHDPIWSLNLNTWDTEQVLWLRPSFVVGRRLQVASPERQVEIRAERKAEQAAAARIAFLTALRDPVEGPAARRWLADLQPPAITVLSKLLGMDLSPDAVVRLVGIPSLL